MIHLCIFWPTVQTVKAWGVGRESQLSTRNCRKSTQVINFDQNDVCVFSQQYYVCLTHYLVDEIGRFLSTKIPILLYNKLCQKPVLLTSTSFSLSLSTLKNVNRFFFRNFWCFINSMYVPVVTLSVTFFSHI